MLTGDIVICRKPEDRPDGPGAAAFIKKFSRPIDKIKFIGVWDTVGALGIPGLFSFVGKELFEFHDVTLSKIVENAYHALALDERRQPFLPTLWEQNAGAVNQTLEQVWFAGVHSNIGGGYSECGLSDIAFTWMAGKAQACDLELDGIPGHGVRAASLNRPLGRGTKAPPRGSSRDGYRLNPWRSKYPSSWELPGGCGFNR